MKIRTIIEATLTVSANARICDAITLERDTAAADNRVLDSVVLDQDEGAKFRRELANVPSPMDPDLRDMWQAMIDAKRDLVSGMAPIRVGTYDGVDVYVLPPKSLEERVADLENKLINGVRLGNIKSVDISDPIETKIVGNAAGRETEG